MRWIAAALLTATALAQPASPENQRREIEARFNSTVPTDLAWGAYLAADYGQADYIPRVIELLKHPDGFVQSVALDSLIRLGAKVQGELLAPFKAIDSALILLARDLRANGPYLNSLLNSPLDSWKWAALSGILVNEPPPGFVGRLFRQWRPQITLRIREDPFGSVNLPGVARLCSDGFPSYSRGGPPLFIYVLGSGRNLVTAGPYPVYYQRSTSYSRCGIVPVSDTLTLEFLRVLSGLSPESRPRPAEPRFTWRDGTQYRREVQSLRDQFRTFVIQIRDALIAKGHMRPEEVTNLPVFEITTFDDRVDKSTPLPVIDWTL